MNFHYIILLLCSIFFLGCQQDATPKAKLIQHTTDKLFSIKKNILTVTSTAYTSCRRETDNTPYLAAWNNRLKPSVKSIAVSRDLLKLGLTNGTKVKISGLKGHYIVLDKMNKRWKKKIDIYMGCNLKRARKWGKRKVTIIWDKK
jgi:3D (Asp-Asp-Asp) domain-containing protein